MIYENILETIGNTPIVKLNNFKDEGEMADIYLKLEFFNPGGSIKDRPAYQMIKAMEERGELKKGGKIIEATSGNTGIGLAIAASVMGYGAVFTMPEDMSIERQKLLSAYGAKLVLTSASEGMNGAIRKAEELASIDNCVMVKQFENPDNWKSHYLTTAQEIMKDFKELDAFVSSVGSGGLRLLKKMDIIRGLSQ